MESIPADRNIWVTRCPNCQTAFRVSLKHLQVARGLVRCGSCLQVFKALEHLISDEPPTDLLEILTTNTTFEPETATRQPDPELRQAGDKPVHDRTNDRNKQRRNEKFPDPSPDNTGATDHGSGHHEDDELPDKSRTHNIPGGLETGSARQKNALSNSSRSNDGTGKTHPSGQQTEREKPAEKLQALENTPVTLHYDQRGQWQSILLWSSLVFAVSVTLVALLLFSSFDTLARQDNWRPVLATICNLLNCELPDTTDVSQIQVSHLTVRSVSGHENKLSVDAIINNRASFSQPFPLIELTFTNDQGKTVISRHFAPKEYLGGELTGATRFPPEQPIHLSLQIIDPGQEATHYQLFFHPAPSS